MAPEPEGPADVPDGCWQTCCYVAGVKTGATMILELLKTIRFLIGRVADKPVQLALVLMFLVTVCALGVVWLVARR